mmetsp:Transcript_107058/g.160039  ORF Transcript_107058/g.160039 Transcript_107058/m.160039 type:complete len:134 (-) Transcript_107058:211-612(-)
MVALLLWFRVPHLAREKLESSVAEGLVEFVSSRVRQAILDASTEIPDSTTTPESEDLAQTPGAESLVGSRGTRASASTPLTRGPAKILEQYYECRRLDSNSQSSTGKQSVHVDNFGFWNPGFPSAADRAAACG